jgi:hypothetical protein
VTITSPANGESFVAPATVGIFAEASDTDGAIARVEFYNGTVKIGEDSSAPFSLSWTDVAEGNYNLRAVATDNSGMTAMSPSVHISVKAPCSASGTITREYWTGISGNFVSAIPVSRAPDGTGPLLLFEGPTGAGTNYGARISGYICPPETGQYYFWIASNDHSELWLSTDDDPANKRRIALVNGATAERQWDKFASQRSEGVLLTRGKSYYIEALHKQGIGSDHVAVGWQLPDGTLERPIPGARLSPSDINGAPAADNHGTEPPTSAGATVNVFPNPVRGVNRRRDSIRAWVGFRSNRATRVNRVNRVYRHFGKR